MTTQLINLAVTKMSKRKSSCLQGLLRLLPPLQVLTLGLPGP